MACKRVNYAWEADYPFDFVDWKGMYATFKMLKERVRPKIPINYPNRREVAYERSIIYCPDAFPDGVARTNWSHDCVSRPENHALKS